MHSHLKMVIVGLLLVWTTTAAVAQTKDENIVATLYRSSVAIENARILIATFNADKASGGDGFAYNWGNCLIAADLFQNQDGVKTRFWCEKGQYRK